MLQALRWAWEPWLAPKIGKLSDGAKGRRWLLRGCCICASLLFFLLPAKMYLWLWLLVVILIQLTGTALTTLTDATATDVAVKDGNAPAVMGAHALAIDLGSALGPLLGYFLNSSQGLAAPFFLAGACLLAVSLIWHKVRIETTIIADR
jgi:MFS family permease